MSDTQFLYTDNAIFSSSVLDQAWYDKDSKTLLIQFVNGGYAAYRTVEKYTWDGLVRSNSAGAFYNRYIKNTAPGVTPPGSGWNPVRRSTQTPTDKTIPSAALSKFVIRGTLEFETEIRATSVEEAIRIFNDDTERAGVKSLQIREVAQQF